LYVLAFPTRRSSDLHEIFNFDSNVDWVQEYFTWDDAPEQCTQLRSLQTSDLEEWDRIMIMASNYLIDNAETDLIKMYERDIETRSEEHTSELQSRFD